MHPVPDVDEVLAVAKELGIHLSPEEAGLYRKYLLEQLSELDNFVQARLDGADAADGLGRPRPGLPAGPEEDRLNAWTWKCRIEPAAGGVLDGKTVSYKDHIAVAGMPMSFGAFALEGFVPDFDATVVTRVLQAGGTVIGKNVMNGLSGGFGTGGGIGDYGRPLNPHNHAHVTGGSSSGSAAAVAAGEVDIPFGGDQGGSIRIPAAFCGIVGHKPTFGLVSHFGIGFGLGPEHRLHGPHGPHRGGHSGGLPGDRRVRPLRSTPDTGGPDPTGRARRAGRRGGRVANRSPPGGLRRRGAEVRDLVLAAVDVLARAGADVSKVSVPAHHAIRTAQAALSGEGALALFRTGFFGAFTRTYYPAPIIAAINRLWAAQADVLAPRTKLSLIAAELSRRTYHGRVYAKAQNVRPAYIKAYDTALTEVDVLVMPTCLMTAPKSHRPATHLEAVEDNLASQAKGFSRNTQPFNYTGHPALALPVGKSSRGLPVSMQLVGRFFDDPLLLRVAHAYQHATDWARIIGVHA